MNVQHLSQWADLFIFLEFAIYFVKQFEGLLFNLQQFKSGFSYKK